MPSRCSAPPAPSRVIWTLDWYPVAVQTADGGEAIAIHPVGNLAMSWDHRAFDGAYAAGFLKFVKQLLETKDWSTEL